MFVEPGEIADRSALLASIVVRVCEILVRRPRNELGWRPRPAETTIVETAESLRDLIAGLTDAVAGVLGEQVRDGTSVELVATPAGRAGRRGPDATGLVGWSY